MKAEDIDKYLAKPNISLVDAMKKIDSNSGGVIYIIDEKGCLIGSLSDGDIRRWIIKTGNLQSEAKVIMSKSVVSLVYDQSEDAGSLMLEHDISSIPIVDENQRIIDIIFSESKKNIIGKKSAALSNVPVIVMAGGRGTRLDPYTKILPKPLIPIGDIPILERIFDRFCNYGVSEFYLTLNYKKEMIKSYFSELATDYSIHYIEEEVPLGTAGSITLINRKFTTPVIVTNCDILIEAEYDKLLNFHKQSDNSMTIVSSLKNIVIPYGVLHSKEEGLITEMEEKPRMSQFINTGMYVLDPDFFALIPYHTVYHMTDLANKMIEQGNRVGMYPISEDSFLDMGEFEELKKMEERITNGRLS